MGKYEVLGWMTTMRMSGEHKYFTYHEIMEGLNSEGVATGYNAVNRCVNDLWSDGVLEAVFEGSITRRTAKFRAKLRKAVQVSAMKRVHNTYRKIDQTSGRADSKGRQAVGAQRG